MTDNRGWGFQAPGNPDVLTEITLPMPAPKAGELLVRVLASAFNPIDTKIRAGLAPIAADNHIVGCDVCGEVVAIGEGVTDFKTGDRIYGCAGGVKGSSGTLCHYLTVDAALVAKAPVSLNAEQAAALPLISITAYEALERLQLTGDDSLLIMGGSGGVGQMALQLAKLKGAMIMATAGDGTRREKLVAVGARALPHDAPEANYYTKVLDTYGGASFQTALVAAAPGAQVATINARNTYDLAQAHAKSLTIHAVFMLLPLLTGKGRLEHGRFLKWLATEVDAGRVSVPEIEVHPASAVAEVHRRYEAGELRTKVVFTL
ncbi:MAG: zinc-binding dehydrogenase [Pseudomonadota bacterium]|nr:zinc-binding dehydrogenase [Pseudomonadota bacterium]